MLAARQTFYSQTTGTTDPYWTNVKMLVQANSGTILDYSTVGATCSISSPTSGTTLVTSPILYSAYSIYNTGGSRWSVASAAARSCTGQFTFEWFWRSAGTTAATQYEVAWACSGGPYSGGNIIGQIGITNSNKWTKNQTGVVYNFTNLNAYDQQWHHIATTRDSSNVNRFFYDGVLFATTQTDSTTYNFDAQMIFGGTGGPDNYSNGYWDQLRLTVGVCRYTTTFTPPTGLFPTS